MRTRYILVKFIEYADSNTNFHGSEVFWQKIVSKITENSFN